MEIMTELLLTPAVFRTLQVISESFKIYCQIVIERKSISTSPLFSKKKIRIAQSEKQFIVNLHTNFFQNIVLVAKWLFWHSV